MKETNLSKHRYVIVLAGVLSASVRDSGAQHGTTTTTTSTALVWHGRQHQLIDSSAHLQSSDSSPCTNHPDDTVCMVWGLSTSTGQGGVGRQKMTTTPVPINGQVRRRSHSLPGWSSWSLAPALSVVRPVRSQSFPDQQYVTGSARDRSQRWMLHVGLCCVMMEGRHALWTARAEAFKPA